MPVGVSSQWNRIWNMEWNNATVQTGVIGASLSEPHIYVISVNFVCLSVRISVCRSVRS